MAKKFGGALFVAFLLAAVIGVLANDEKWVFSFETTRLSSEAVEKDGTPPNLCEGTQGYLTGGDPGWVRVSGDPNPNQPFFMAEGQVLPDLQNKTNPFVTHTDAPFNHYSHDVNAFVTLDAPYRIQLASGAFAPDVDAGEHGAIEVEWERSGIPMFAWPAPHDRIKLWGPLVWDCGHGDIGDPNESEFTYRTEIHPPVGWVLFRNTSNHKDRDETPRDAKRTQSPWVWYEFDDFQGTGAVFPDGALFNTPVQATVADAFFSTFGGNIPSALNGCEDDTLIADETVDASCYYAISAGSVDWAQPLLNQDYSFFIPAPPKPADTATMIWHVEDRCGEVPASPGNPPGDNVEDVSEADDTAENIGAPGCQVDSAYAIPETITVTEQNGQPGIQVTVKAASGGVSYPSNAYLAYAKRFKVGWDHTQPANSRLQTYQVDFNSLDILDDSDETSDGEFVMSLRVNENWIHPLRGHGDDDDPFWENGAVGSGESYSMDARLVATPGPGQPLRIWVRSWDDDTSFAQDNDVNDVFGYINEYFTGVLSPGSSTLLLRTTSGPRIGDFGSYSVFFTITNITKPSPSAGTLLVGTPTYGPNADTGGKTRVSGATPIRLDGSNGTFVEYRFRRINDTFISPWAFGTTLHPWEILTSGLSDARYTVQFAPVSADGIVDERQFFDIELDTTPPSLTVPESFKIEATSAAGRIVEWNVTASDSLPGPVTSSCVPASGSFFKIKHVTPVTCSAHDAVGNTTTKTFTVEVYSPFGYIPDFVVLGREWADLGTDVKVTSGNVGAFDTSAGAPSAPGFEVVLGAAGTMGSTSKIATHSSRLLSFASAGEDYFVDQTDLRSGATHVPKTGYVPLFLNMPDFSATGAGGVNHTVQDTLALPPGAYGTLVVKPNARVTLTSAGEYAFQSIELGVGASFDFTGSGSAIVRIAGRVRLNNDAVIGETAAANRLIMFVGGTDAPNETGAAFASANGVQLKCSVYAANGTLQIGPYAVAAGTFLGRRVRVANNASLTLVGGAFDIIYP